MLSASCKHLRNIHNRSSNIATNFHYISAARISKLSKIPTNPVPTGSTFIDDLDLVPMNVANIYLESYDPEFVKLRQEVEAITVFTPKAISVFGWKNYAALAIEKRADTLSQRIDDVAADLRKFCDQINNASDDNFDLLINTVTGMQQELEKEKIDKAAIQKYLDEQSHRLEEMQKQLNSYKITLKQTRSELNDTETNLADITKEKEAVDEELEMKISQLNDEQLTNNALESDIEYVTTLKETLGNENNELKNDKESMKSKHASRLILCFVVTSMIGMWLHWNLQKQSDDEKKKMISVHDEILRSRNEEIRKLQEDLKEIKKENKGKSIGSWIAGWL